MKHLENYEKSGYRVHKHEKAPEVNRGLVDKMAATYSPTWFRSTIGAIGLNFSVRNGKRWIPNAITT